MFGSLGVQVVTFHNEPAQLVRLAEGLTATLAGAKRAGVDTVAVRFGDSSQPATIESYRDAVERVLGPAVDHLDVVAFDANLGSGGGSNALAALGDDEVVWVLNPDTYPSPGCAAAMLAALGGDGVGAVDARQIPIEHPKDYDHVGGDTSWGSGSCLMIRRAAFDAVGGFDDHFFPMYCDDVDISWRLRLAGWRVVHSPSAAVFHDKRIDIGAAIAVSDFERRSGALARLWLTRRYGRPDLEAETLAWIDESGEQAHREAAAEFRRRVEAGDVPEELAGADGVAQFVAGEYAEHRFGYVT